MFAVRFNCVRKRQRWVGVLLAGIAAFAGGRAASAQEGDAERAPAVEGQVYDHRGGGTADVEVSLLPAIADDSTPPVGAARTNQYGDFAIYNDEPLSGSFTVVFRKPGYAETRRDIEIVPGELPPFVDILLPGSVALRGTVLRVDGGAPCEGATVRLESGGRDWSVKTAPDGTYLIESILPGSGVVTVEAKGLGRERKSVESLQDGKPLEFRLGPDKVCTIRIGDWRGKPIQGVRLTAYDDRLHDRWFGESDKDGVVVLRGLHREAAELRVQLSHPDYVSDSGPNREILLPGDARESEHVQSLLTAGKVGGKVVDADGERPLQGVRVTVGVGMNPALPRTWTDFDGAFLIGGVPPGPTIVTTYLRGYAPELKSIKITPEAPVTVAFTMQASKEAGGTVANAEGKPVAGAYVFATSWRGHEALGVQALTDDQGRFAMDTIPQDEFAVAAQAAGMEMLEDQTITPGKMNHRFEMKARSKAPGPAVTLKTGEAFPDLELVTADGKPLKTSDLRGKFVLIDFWATWCGPCVAEIPHLVKLNEALGERADFAMINISVDEERDSAKVRKLIKQRKMNWAHVYGKDSGAQKASDACGVSFLPTKFLIAPDGTLKTTDLHGATMIEAIGKFLSAQRDAAPTP